ncbi:MAG TPA: hypothetical protein VGO87_08815 [Acidimicrobiia bacterium]|jgi:hypothetical protein
MHHITQSGWICTRVLAKAAVELGPDRARGNLPHEARTVCNS